MSYWTGVSCLLKYWIFPVLHWNLAPSDIIHFSNSYILPPYIVVASVWKTCVYSHESNLIHCDGKK